MITEQRALEISKEVGLYVMLPVGYEKEFTRALNLAAAEALESVLGGLRLNGDKSRVIRAAKEHREAAK